jgi:hypothetical protein
MKADKKDTFKKVVKLAADENPVVDFTMSVMQIIEDDLQHEAALKVLLQKEEAIGPSFNFTAKVMAGINASRPQFVYKPIITKKGWYGIASMIMVFIAISIASNTSAASSSASQTRMKFFVDYIAQIPITYLMAMAVVVLLLAADYLVDRLNGNKSADSPA